MIMYVLCVCVCVTAQNTNHTVRVKSKSLQSQDGVVWLDYNITDLILEDQEEIEERVNRRRRMT